MILTGDKPVPMPLCPPQIPIKWNLTYVSAVTAPPLTPDVTVTIISIKP